MQKIEVGLRYFLTLFIQFLPVICLSQISSPTSNAIRFTQYPSAPELKHPIFIFCNSTGNVKGSLYVESPGGTAPFDFTWNKWDTTTKDFSIFINTESGVLNSSADTLSEGGYKVRIVDGTGYDTSLVAWVYLDTPYAEAKLKHFNCYHVALSGKAAVDTFYYYDPLNGNEVRLKNSVSFMWSSIPSSSIPFPNIELNPVTYTPPLENVVYKLQVTDSFMCSAESSFPYTSIHVKADFTVSPTSGEAPLEVTFTDKSVRGFKYLWKFGDDSISTFKNPPPHIYYKPGEYYVTLIVESDKLCIDSMKSEKIVVEPSKLDIPNVFTPDGDGINDFFIVESKSLRSLSVEIYSRSGMMVYSFYGEGQTLSEWEGWDGTINKSGIKAVPGIYFYIIRARGWDDIIYEGKAYRGFLYLYR
ncbi:MAG: gliding motility-associated C-terminal domain-containing protein [Bacteroidales bacterium]|nr:gliding motility-associated C-terminal domain-containing protein [Bacteroidales bacterium]